MNAEKEDKLVEALAKVMAERSDEWDFRVQARAALSAIRAAGYTLFETAALNEAIRMLQELHAHSVAHALRDSAIKPEPGSEGGE